MSNKDKALIVCLLLIVGEFIARLFGRALFGEITTAIYICTALLIMVFGEDKR